ncbi:MAG TPA: hypothetical protein VJ742_12710 [Nitrososphaera sp.]|nr:hypothetical protein [Nitrososphaera sp.]
MAQLGREVTEIVVVPDEEPMHAPVETPAEAVPLAAPPERESEPVPVS